MLRRAALLLVVGAGAAVLSLSAAGAVPVRSNVYFRAADDGIGRTKAVWWNPAANWYSQQQHVDSDGPRDVATLWDVFPLFEAIDIVAKAHPTAKRRAAVAAIARGAERYWNPDLKPVGGYYFLPFRRPNANFFFDDNGWWGLAFFDAYTATHNKRFLRDAIRAYRFIAIAGWAGNAGGGIWWDTEHEKKTSEPLAAEALLAAELYGATHQRAYLKEALRLLGWANKHSWNRARRLYQRNETDGTVMNYVEGMMIGAHATLCRVLHKKSFCAKGEKLAAASARAFPLGYHWATETDAIYYRWLLTLYEVNHNPRWYRLAQRWANRALANSRDSRGLYTKRWDGSYADARRLLTPGGTLMLLAAVAAAPHPGKRH